MNQTTSATTTLLVQQVFDVMGRDITKQEIRFMGARMKGTIAGMPYDHVYQTFVDAGWDHKPVIDEHQQHDPLMQCFAKNGIVLFISMHEPANIVLRR